MESLRYGQFCIMLLVAALLGCTQPRNSEDLKEKTAEATAQLKRDAKAVAGGIREGWTRDRPLDLNTATKQDLLSLPDITPSEANRVIAGRPYNEPKELVIRRIISDAKYDKISDRITVKK